MSPKPPDNRFYRILTDTIVFFKSMNCVVGLLVPLGAVGDEVGRGGLLWGGIRGGRAAPLTAVLLAPASSALLPARPCPLVLPVPVGPAPFPRWGALSARAAVGCRSPLSILPLRPPGPGATVLRSTTLLVIPATRPSALRASLIPPVPPVLLFPAPGTAIFSPVSPVILLWASRAAVFPP